MSATTRSLQLPVFVILLLILSTQATRDLAAFQVWLELATVKVRQDSPPVDREPFRIQAARNEFESFQLVIQTRSSESLQQVDIEISDFMAPGAVIPSSNVTIFLVKYLNVENVSSMEGIAGEWPDILCPKVDAYYKETRDFFPFDIEPGRNQPIWFDVFVPYNAKPGSYSGLVTVKVGNTDVLQKQVNLQVWDFALPATSSLPNVFSMSMDTTWQGHYGGSWPPGGWDAILPLIRTYLRAGLRHRLTFTPVPVFFSDWDPVLQQYGSVDSTHFMASIRGFVGDGDPQVEYFDRAELTALMTNFSLVYQTSVDCDGGYTTPPADLLAKAEKRAEALSALLTPRQRARFSVLPLDEPGGGEVGCGSDNPELDFNSVKEMAKRIHAQGLDVQITKKRIPELLNVRGENEFIDLWISPFMNIVGRDPSGDFIDRRAEYAADIAAGAQLWWYQSCMTHACGAMGGPEYNGYPQYGVEYQAIYSRIFPWMTFRYSIHGELYWAVTYSYSDDPWHTLWMPSYVGNGDGTFFYPGVPNTTVSGLTAEERGEHTPNAGGMHHIPIESIRLKMIREGYEDYEYLNILKGLGASGEGEDFAMQQAGILVQNTYTFLKDPTRLYEVREAVAEKIVELGGHSSGDTVPPASPSNLRILRTSD